jgi:hypothetical protein
MNQAQRLAATRAAKHLRPVAPEARAPGTYVSWRTYRDGYSDLHILGPDIDGYGFPLTQCGAIAHDMPEMPEIVREVAHGIEALLQKPGRAVCVPCQDAMVRRKGVGLRGARDALNNAPDEQQEKNRPHKKGDARPL